VSNLRGIFRRDDPLPGEHLGVCLGRGDVLAVEAPVDLDRGIDLRHDRVRLRREAAAPHLVAHGTTETVPTMTTSTDHPTQGRLARRLVLVAAVALVGGVAGLAGVYGIGGLTGNPAGAACRQAAETAKRLTPLSRGEVAAVAVAAAPQRVPDLAFRDGGGV